VIHGDTQNLWDALTGNVLRVEKPLPGEENESDDFVPLDAESSDPA